MEPETPPERPGPVLPFVFGEDGRSGPGDDDIRASMERIEARLDRIERHVAAVRIDAAEARGMLELLPNAWQLALIVAAIVLLMFVLLGPVRVG